MTYGGSLKAKPLYHSVLLLRLIHLRSIYVTFALSVSSYTIKRSVSEEMSEYITNKRKIDACKGLFGNRS